MKYRTDPTPSCTWIFFSQDKYFCSVRSLPAQSTEFIQPYPHPWLKSQQRMPMLEERRMKLLLLWLPKAMALSKPGVKYEVQGEELLTHESRFDRRDGKEAS